MIMETGGFIWIERLSLEMWKGGIKRAKKSFTCDFFCCMYAKFSEWTVKFHGQICLHLYFILFLFLFQNFHSFVFLLSSGEKTNGNLLLFAAFDVWIRTLPQFCGVFYSAARNWDARKCKVINGQGSSNYCNTDNFLTDNKCNRISLQEQFVRRHGTSDWKESLFSLRWTAPILCN